MKVGQRATKDGRQKTKTQHRRQGVPVRYLAEMPFEAGRHEHLYWLEECPRPPKKRPLMLRTDWATVLLFVVLNKNISY